MNFKKQKLYRLANVYMSVYVCEQSARLLKLHHVYNAHCTTNFLQFLGVDSSLPQYSAYWQTAGSSPEDKRALETGNTVSGSCKETRAEQNGLNKAEISKLLQRSLQQLGAHRNLSPVSSPLQRQ